MEIKKEDKTNIKSHKNTTRCYIYLNTPINSDVLWISQGKATGCNGNFVTRDLKIFTLDCLLGVYSASYSFPRT